MGTLMISLPDEVKEYLKKVSEAEKKPISKIIVELILLKKIMDEISWDYIFEKFSKRMGKVKREDMWK